jgi:hypothetical protein
MERDRSVRRHARRSGWAVRLTLLAAISVACIAAVGASSATAGSSKGLDLKGTWDLDGGTFVITSRSAKKIVGETPTGYFAITGSISNGSGVLDFTYSNANGDWTDVYVVNSASDIAMSGVEYETGPDAPAPPDPTTACQNDPGLDCTAWSAVRGATCSFASTMGRPGSDQAPDAQAGGKYYF